MRSSFDDQLAVLNQQMMTTFGTETVSYQRRIDGTEAGGDIDIPAIPIDPLRLEGYSNGNFAIRWLQKQDLDDAGITPARGDIVVLSDSDFTRGGNYTVIQVQVEVGGGTRLVLERRAQASG